MASQMVTARIPSHSQKHPGLATTSIRQSDVSTNGVSLEMVNSALREVFTRLETIAATLRSHSQILDVLLKYFETRADPSQIGIQLELQLPCQTTDAIKDLNKKLDNEVNRKRLVR